MSSDVHITIFGKIETLKALEEVAQAGAQDGMFDWNDGIDEDDVIERIMGIKDGSGELGFTRQDTNVFFYDLRDVCEENGLSYYMVVGHSGHDDFHTEYSWAPGMDEVAVMAITGEDHTVMLSDLRKAAKGGADALLEYVNGFAKGSLAHAPKTISVDQSVLDEYEAANSATP